jgi:tRNA threonylcarbamoyl adenosine modification protein YeaZ
MKTLGLELSTARGSLAWLGEGRRQLFREWPNDRQNSGPLFENLADVQKQFGAPDMIVVGLGPGSYAGVRIAISAAIGLQAASNARLIGLPSICAMETGEHEYCVIGDARRQSFFFARVRTNNLTEGPILLSEIELRDRIDKLEDNMSIFASEKLPQFKRVVIVYPSAMVLARLAQDPHRNFASPPLEPIYLREPHITIPKKAKIAL